MRSVLNFNNLNKAYLIAEIGINHNGDINIAKKLIDAAYSIGWDCVKFQKRSPHICVPDHQKKIVRETPWGKMTYLDYKYKVEFESEQYDEIDKYCNSKNPQIDWSASVWDLQSLNFLVKYKVPFIKVPSAMITNLELVKECASTKIPLIFSTGMCEIKEIDEAVNIISKHNSNYCLLHTNSTYPAPIEDLNLSLIPFYIDRYKCTVGYSGHEYNIEPTVIAVALGAKLIERHVTLNHEMWGTDHKSSLTISGMDRLLVRLRTAEKAIGQPKKLITPQEKEIRKKLSN
tara:strand:+ start:1830 stop:2693 length:864 start_codon:yes stop_codon:yes gene_type:complete